MARTVPTTEFESPETGAIEFTAGDSVSFDIPENPDLTIADGWNLTYSLIGPSTLHTPSSEVTENGTTYEVRIPATRTSPLKPGTYRWSALLKHADEGRVTWRTGMVQVYPNPQDQQAETTLEDDLLAVETAIRAIETGGVASFQINGRAVNKLDLPTLYKRQAALSIAIIRRDSGGSPFLNQHGVTFVAP